MIVTRDVIPGVHRLGHPRVNWYLVEQDDRFTAVDAGLPGFAGDLEADLAGLGARFEDVEAVILTHGDADHIGLVRQLHDGGARVLISAVDDAALRKPGPKGGDASPVHALPELWRPSLWMMISFMVRNGGAKVAGFDGAETFQPGDVLDVPGRPRVIGTPGHTPGHCAFYFEQQKALFVGDAMCTWNPITASDGAQLMPRPFNVSNQTALESLAALEPYDGDVTLFGHGDPWHGALGPALAQARDLRR